MWSKIKSVPFHQVGAPWALLLYWRLHHHRLRSTTRFQSRPQQMLLSLHVWNFISHINGVSPQPLSWKLTSLLDNSQNQQSKAHKDKCNQTVLHESNADLIMSQFEKFVLKLTATLPKILMKWNLRWHCLPYLKNGDNNI